MIDYLKYSAYLPSAKATTQCDPINPAAPVIKMQLSGMIVDRSR